MLRVLHALVPRTNSLFLFLSFFVVDGCPHFCFVFRLHFLPPLPRSLFLFPSSLALNREGLDEEGNLKKTETYLHKGGVQEFVELMCKDKMHLHPEMKVGGGPPPFFRCFHFGAV